MTAHGRIPFVCGNWKLHHGREATCLQVRELVAGLPALNGRAHIAVAPVITCLEIAVIEARGQLPIAAQNVHFAEKGAFTGEWSVGHVKEIGASYVIVGHSERRAMFNDTNETVAKKVRAVLDGGLLPIACVGETEGQREQGRTKHVITEEIEPILAAVKPEEADKLTLAYEPVWAIGTGKNASPQQAQEVHALIRALLTKHFGAKAEVVRIQYGGSVKADNIATLISETDVDGALVGGASLEAKSLLAIAANSIR
ncbi:MAG: triose-phosphate isomerase [Deltaproteobacteria bacterium]|nr:triose-phosphate isomerase [Deltaproteobacteria bacterium]